MYLLSLTLSFGIFLLMVILRILYVALATVRGWRKGIKRSAQEKVKTVIVLGSGGHTSEMMYIVQALSITRYSPRLYIMGSSDNWSYQPVLEFEEKIKNNVGLESCDFEITNIPRSRSVHQPYITSVFTTLYSTLMTVPILFRFKPDLILCNGPGTCIPICVIAFMMRCSFLSDNKIIFIESVCRVKSLSLSGKILQWFVDSIFVQWPELRLKSKRAKYIGRVI